MNDVPVLSNCGRYILLPPPFCSSFAIISAYDFVSPLNINNTPVI
jgi:hypothetical protein